MDAEPATPPAPASFPSMPTGQRRLVVVAVLLAWLALTLPLALGWETLFLRDVSNHFLPFKSFGVEQLKQGRIPAFNPTCALGQPYRGDPGMLAFYPGNLLFLVLPFWIAFNLHYLLHWLLAYFTLGALARGLGLGREAAWIAGLAWAGGGFVLSCLSFHNLLVVAAWWPLVLLGAVRGGRRGIALGGLACGLALLGGEPMTAALGMVPLLVLVVPRRGWLRALGTALAVGLLGLLVALPQIVATLRVLDFTQRASQGIPPAAFYFLHPARLLELLLPLPYGEPAGWGAAGYWARGVMQGVPFIFSIHLGLPALVLALVGARRRLLWATMAVAGLLLAWLGGAAPDLLRVLSGGLFRIPEKFLFWFALFAALLAGAGFGAVARKVVALRAARLALILAGVSLLAAGLAVWAGPGVIEALAAPSGQGVAEERLAELVARWPVRWMLAALLSAGLAAATAVALRSRNAVAVVALQLVALLPLAGLVATAPVADFAEPAPWARELPAGTAVVSIPHTLPTRAPAWQLPPGAGEAEFRRLRHLNLDFPTGVRAGLTYPLGPDAVGFHSPYSHLLNLHLWGAPVPRLVQIFRILGVEVVVATEPRRLLDTPALRRQVTPLGGAERQGVVTALLALEGTAPQVWWPERVMAAPSPVAAVEAALALPDPVTTVVAPRAFPQSGDPVESTVELVEHQPDRLVLEVESPGGLVAARRTFQPLLRARIEGSPSGEGGISSLPVNGVLLGLAVPPGRYRVVVEVSSVPEMRAGMVAGVVVLILLGVLAAGGWAGRRSV